MPRTHQCHICQKILSRSTVLREHLRSHADERPYPCQRCGRAFTRRWDQEQHEKTHTEAYKYTCGDGQDDAGCGKNFHRKRDLRRHQGSARCRKTTEEAVATEEPSGALVLVSSPLADTFAKHAIGFPAWNIRSVTKLAPSIGSSNTSSSNTDGRLPYGIERARQGLSYHFRSTRAQDLLVDDASGIDLFTMMNRQTVHHPAVRHSLTAVTLLCIRLAEQRELRTSRACSIWLTHYLLAMKAVQQAFQTPSPDADCSVLVTAAMNFSTIESLMGNLCRAFLHLKGASSVLKLGERQENAAHHKVLRQYLSKTLDVHQYHEAKRQHFMGPSDHLCFACPT